MYSRMPAISFIFLLLAIAALFGLSGNMLYQAGIFYDSAGGNPLHKIHPSFYFLLLSVACWGLLYEGGRQSLIFLVLLRSNFILLLAAGSLFCYDLLLSRPLSSAIVSYISATFFFLLLKSLSAERLQQARKVMLLLLAANAVVGIYEYSSGGLIVPLILTDVGSGDIIDTTEWGQVRSAGLMGHPLTSSMVCGFYLVCYFAKLLFSRLSIAEHLTAALVVIALPLFGGRGAIAAALVIILLLLVIKFIKIFQQKGSSVQFLFYSLLSFIALPILVYLGFRLGLLEPLLSRLEDDQGSAGTRLIALEIFMDTSWWNLLLGDIDRSLSGKLVLYGTRYGIEIGWVALILSYGAILSALLIYALYCAVTTLCRNNSYLVVFPWLYSVIAWTSGTGISGKTLMLSAAIVITLVLFPVRKKTSDHVVTPSYG
ncbi:VpsF family polysaccharide biosynthesis protein [Chromatiaceae bacterium AAb-1]|nr:VpsF family polysaccharide biosynthesis protein [Chromatiaceae bacterium AAb-1]